LSSACPIGNPQPGPLTILVAEDDILLRMATTDELRKQGFNVAEATNADEALSIVQSGIPIHLVLTDSRMPSTQEGASLAATIRAEYPDIKVIVASGQADADQPGQQVDGFLKKPYDLVQLVGLIKALLDS